MREWFYLSLNHLKEDDNIANIIVNATLVTLSTIGLIAIFNKIEGYISKRSDEKLMRELEQDIELQEARDDYIISKATERSIKAILDILDIDEED